MHSPAVLRGRSQGNNTLAATFGGPRTKQNKTLGLRLSNPARAALFACSMRSQRWL